MVEDHVPTLLPDLGDQQPEPQSNALELCILQLEAATKQLCSVIGPVLRLAGLAEYYWVQILWHCFSEAEAEYNAI